MPRNRSIPLSPVLLLALGALGGNPTAPRLPRPSAFEARELARLRLHFDSVETELGARDVSGLTPAQRAARSEQILLVHAYAARGAFPRNEDFPGRWVPYFRDRHGTLCAMAFLIAASGRGDIVDHVARTRNNAWLPDLVDEPGLLEWLQDHGLTVAEAARIQPTYGGPEEKKEVGGGYAAAAGAATVLAGTSVVMNFRSLDKVTRNRGRGFLGLAFGGIAIGFGAASLGDYTTPGDAIGIWSISLGSAAAILGARSLLWKRPASAAVPRAESRLEFMPVALPGHAPQVGVAARLRL